MKGLSFLDREAEVDPRTEREIEEEEEDGEETTITMKKTKRKLPKYMTMDTQPLIVESSDEELESEEEEETSSAEEKKKKKKKISSPPKTPKKRAAACIESDEEEESDDMMQASQLPVKQAKKVQAVAAKEEEMEESTKAVAVKDNPSSATIDLSQTEKGFKNLKFLLTEMWSIAVMNIVYDCGSYDALVLIKGTESDQADKKKSPGKPSKPLSINIPLKYAKQLQKALHHIIAERKGHNILTCSDELKAFMRSSGEWIDGIFVTNIATCAALPKLKFKLSPSLFVKTHSIKIKDNSYDAISIIREAKTTKKPFSLSLPASHLQKFSTIVDLVVEATAE